MTFFFRHLSSFFFNLHDQFLNVILKMMKNDHVLQALTLYVYLENARLAKKM